MNSECKNNSVIFPPQINQPQPNTQKSFKDDGSHDRIPRDTLDPILRTETNLSERLWNDFDHPTNDASDLKKNNLDPVVLNNLNRSVDNLGQNSCTTFFDGDKSRKNYLAECLVGKTEMKNFNVKKERDRFNGGKIVSGDQNKLSMFSAEIWTEKLLPVDPTLICAEPEQAELHVDGNQRTGKLDHFENCSRESINSSKLWNQNGRNFTGRNISANPLLSVNQNKAQSSGQKTINFNDEIWPVCPKLIPCGKELEITMLGDGHDPTLSPEKLIENCGKLKNPFGKRETVEPTHEIESLDELTVISRNDVTSELQEVAENDIDKIKETKKNQKPVKVVRFKTCDKRSNIRENKIALADRDKKSQSVESFKQEIDQLADEIASQIERDSISKDAVETLARVEIIVEANRQTVERIQQLQKNVVLPKLSPSDAGKSIARALMRCRNYMQINGYSCEATDTINNLLLSTVRNLKEAVDRQKQLLATQEEPCVNPWGRQYPRRARFGVSQNSRGVLAADEIGTTLVKDLLSDLLRLSENIELKLDGKNVQKKLSNFSRSVENDIKMNKISSEPAQSKLTKNNSGKVQKTDSKNLTVDNTVPHHLWTENVQQNHPHKIGADLIASNLPVAPTKYPKKPLPGESSKTLKKLFNEIWENRTKITPRHSVANDPTLNLRLISGGQNGIVSQKPPAWKPGGNNPVQSNVSIVGNTPKIRLSTSSSSHKRKNLREMKSQKRSRIAAGTARDLPKAPVKSILKSCNAVSLGREGGETKKSHKIEMSLIRESKHQMTAENDESRARKPRSKSRTRTTIQNRSSRAKVTEIPLEYVEKSLLTNKKEIPNDSTDLKLKKKPSSSPKDIIQMLEDLIKSSSHHSSIQRFSSERIVASKVSKKVDSRPSDERNDHVNKVCSQIEPTLLKSVGEEKVKTDELPVESNQSQVINEPGNLKFESCSNDANAKVIFRTVNCLAAEEEPNTPSVPNFNTTSEISFESTSKSCLSSKCCQASMTSFTSQEISSQLSDIDDKLSFCGEKIQRESNESCNNPEDSKLFTCPTQEVSIDRTIQKKTINKHARSLELLREILSDQNLDVRLLNRAENEVIHKRKCMSIKQKIPCTNLSISKMSNEVNASSTKLTTLAEVENVHVHVEAATMTTVNDSAAIRNGDNDEKVDKALLSKADTAENSTQFDVILKSDVSVGALDIPPAAEKTKLVFAEKHLLPKETSQTNFQTSNDSSQQLLTQETTSPDHKLPNDILEAFKLATIRASNLYGAFHILEKNQLKFTEPEKLAESQRDAIETTQDHSRQVSTNFGPHGGNNKSPEGSRIPKIISPAKIIQGVKIEVEKSLIEPSGDGLKKTEQLVEVDSRHPVPSKSFLDQKKLFQSRKTMEKIGDQGDKTCSSLEGRVEESKNEKSIETLHFAQKKASPDFRQRVEKVETSPRSRSRIETLLAENMQRFRTDCNLMKEERVFEDYERPISVDSSDDESSSVYQSLNETKDMLSGTSSPDFEMIAEVKGIVSRVLKKVEESCESVVPVREERGFQTRKEKRSRKLCVRKLNLGGSKGVVRREEILSKYRWDNLRKMIVRREHILSLIYAIICSFVFCCLQFTVYCEV